MNSTHHQAVRVAGRGLEVFARSADHAAIIEGMAGTDPGQWLVGVQWHPERLPGEEASRALMADYLAACGQRARETR